MYRRQDLQKSPNFLEKWHKTKAIKVDLKGILLTSRFFSETFISRTFLFQFWLKCVIKAEMSYLKHLFIILGYKTKIQAKPYSEPFV